MGDVLAGLLAVILICLLLAGLALLGGLITLAIVHVFQLQDDLHLNLWEAIGVALLLGGVTGGTAVSNR
jgi:hypothetical protein